MALETILQHEVLTRFAYPFLLIFFIFYAVLEKTKILTSDKHQINAFVSFVIALIFASALQPKIIVSNLILFLTVGMVVMFVGLLLWGFVTGGDLKVPIESKGLRWTFGIVILIAVFFATLWAMGIWSTFFDLLFHQSWSESFWTNAVFIVAIILALYFVLKSSGGSK
jgi:hypothetical protein